MKMLSPDFRRGFEQTDMASYARGMSTILACDGTQLRFIHETLTADEYRHLRMVVYFRQD